MGEFVSYPKFVSPATKTLHPDSIGAILKLLGGLSIGNSDTPLTGQLKVGVAAGSGYITFYPGSYVPGHLDGSELLFDISGAEALKLLADGTLRIRNNKMFTARNAADNADLALVGRNASDGLVLGSGLTGVLKAVSSVISAAGIVNADVDSSAGIAASKIAAGGGTFGGSGLTTFPGSIKPSGPYTLMGDSTAFSTATSLFSFTAASGGGILFVALAGNTQGAAFAFDGAASYKLSGHANWVAGVPGSGQRGVKLFTNFIQLEDGDGISRTGNWIALVG